MEKWKSMIKSFDNGLEAKLEAISANVDLTNLNLDT
jgi:hypothetical protein